MYTIELLPAAHGDALWIEYGDPRQPMRIVIDGGPAHTYDRGLRARFQRLRSDDRAAGRDSLIDLFVVTHIDCDHIDGAVILLRESKAQEIDIQEVWFNAWKHIAESSIEVFAPLQGEFLGALVGTDPTFNRRWNARFARKAIFVPDDGPLPSVDLPQQGRLTLLSPYASQLTRLRRKWFSAIRAFNPGDEAAALARLEERREYRPPPVSDTFSAQTYGSDPSAPNGSSIAFILEHDERSCLFAGDAHARVLAQSLRRLAKERGVDRIRLDAVKLPHHASMGNVSDELLSLISCDTWLISTNGAVFGHPDRKTVELLGKTCGPRLEILCNYFVETTRALAPRSDETWKVSYPGKGASTAPIGGLLLDLMAKPGASSSPSAATSQEARTLVPARKPRKPARRKRARTPRKRT